MASEINIGTGAGDDENRLFRGEDKEFVVEVLDGPPNDADPTQGGQPVDVAGFTLAWAVRVSDIEADPPLIEKGKGGALTGVTVEGAYNAARQTNTQRVVIGLVRTDTLTLRPNQLRHSLRRVDSGHNTLLAYGDFLISEATTR